jgi:3-hydroxyisobutyrate dehydrogenase
MAKCAFIGLGVMGYPMAGHLAAKGHDVCVYNRTGAKAEAWVEQHGGRMAQTPHEAARDAEFVMACVGNDDDLREVVAGAEGALHGMEAGAVFVDHTTVSSRVTLEMAEQAQARGVAFVDAPVCGGPQDAYDRAEPVIGAYAKLARRLGETGAGQMTKMVNQICIAGLVQGLSEGLAFAEQAGLDGRKVVEVIGGGAAGSWQMVNRHETMLDDEFDHGFAVNWMRKDLGICLETAKEIGATLPVTALVDQFYADVQAMGGGRWDTSSLIRRLRPRRG